MREARVKTPRSAISPFADHKFFEIVTSVAHQKMHFKIYCGVFWTGLISQKEVFEYNSIFWPLVNYDKPFQFVGEKKVQ